MTTLLANTKIQENKLILDGISWEKFQQIESTFKSGFIMIIY